MILVVMGVTGCGKTTLGQELAAALSLPFYDADHYHPPANRDKLNKDIPLDDTDRAPWLAELARLIGEWEAAGGAVLACSALKKRYREVLRSGAPDVRFVYIHSRKEDIAHRLESRALAGHLLIRDYSRILEGQYRDLEEPRAAVTVSHELAPADAVREIITQLSRPM